MPPPSLCPAFVHPLALSLSRAEHLPRDDDGLDRTIESAIKADFQWRRVRRGRDNVVAEDDLVEQRLLLKNRLERVCDIIYMREQVYQVWRLFYEIRN